MFTRLHVSPALVGGYIALVYVGAMVASTLAGPLVLRFGALRVSQWGLMACASGMALMALSSDLGVAMAAAFITGLGYGPITPASSHLLARSTSPERASLVFSVKQTGVPLGGVLAGALVPPVAVAFGVQSALWAVCTVCIACAVVAQPLHASLDADRQPGSAIGAAGLWGPLQLVLKHAQLRRLAAVSFVFSAMQMCLATYLVTYLTADLAYSLVAAGAALATGQIGGVAGRILWGWIADHWMWPVHLLAMLALLMAVCTAATAALPADLPAGVVFALLALFGACATGWNGVYLAEVARQAPKGQASSATGGSLAFTFFGAVLSPVLFSGLSEFAGSYRAGFAVMAVPTLICGWVLSVRKVR